MGGSAKPRRRRAAAPALRYERSPGPRPTRRKTGATLFGGLVLLGVVGCVVPFALLERELGDSTWRWAADRPGGAYGFAGVLGVAGPLVAVLGVRSLMRMPWTTWRRQRGRALRIAGTAAALAAALVSGTTRGSGAWACPPPSSPAVRSRTSRSSVPGDAGGRRPGTGRTPRLCSVPFHERTFPTGPPRP